MQVLPERPVVATPSNSKFKAGDTVIFINDYGVNWGTRTVSEVVFSPRRGFTYYLAESDTPWYDHNEKSLFFPDDPAIQAKTFCYGHGVTPPNTTPS